MEHYCPYCRAWINDTIHEQHHHNDSDEPDEYRDWRTRPRAARVEAEGMLEIGCYIKTDSYPDYDTIVVTSIDGSWVGLRYLAVRVTSDREVWARGLASLDLVTFVSSPDERSRWVVGLRGQYPENIYK